MARRITTALMSGFMVAAITAAVLAAEKPEAEISPRGTRRIPLTQIGRGPTPIVDGRLTDAGWQSCAQLFPFIEAEGSGLAKTQTKALVFYSDAGLHVAFRCDEPNVGGLAASCTKRDDGVWRDDCVEMFIQRPGQKGWYRLIANSLGATYDAKNRSAKWSPQLAVKALKESAKWNPQLAVKAFKEKAAWGVELSIPWADLGGAPGVQESWRVNFCRKRKVEDELSCWSCTYGKTLAAEVGSPSLPPGFRRAKPERFGEIVFGESAVRLEEIVIPDAVPGANRARVRLNVPNTAQVRAGDGKAVQVSPGKPVELVYPVGLSADETVFSAQVDGQVVWRVAVPTDVRPRPRLATLNAALAGLRKTQGQLPKETPLVTSLADTLARAKTAGDALQAAIERSLADGKPLSMKEYEKLNSAVAAEARSLNRMSWTVWTKSNWLDLGRTEMPESIESISELSFTSLVNEYESGNVIITNLGDKALRLRVTTGDFEWQTPVAGVKPSFGGVRPQLLLADWQELRGGKTGGKIVADPLIPLNCAGRLDVPPGESRQVWITLPARDLPPGQYQCSLVAKPLAQAALEGSPPAKSVMIRLGVKPLRISTSPNFAVYNWDYARDEAYVQDLYEHKVNFYRGNTGMPSPGFDAKGNPTGEADYSRYDPLLRSKIEYARKAGGQILFAYGIIRDFHNTRAKKHGWQFRDEAWDRAFRCVYTQWLDHLKALGLSYDDYCVQVWDEATGPLIHHVVEGGKLLREIDPRVRLVMDGVQSLEEVKRIDPYIDVWIPHLFTLQRHDPDGKLLDYYKQTGEPVYTYTCERLMKAQSPYTYHRLKPWQAAQFGVEGVFYWAYNSWKGDPWDDFDGPREDCGVIYPAAYGRPITSRRWEASREGIEDWQIIRLLQDLAKEGSDASKLIDDAIQRVLSEPAEVDRAQTARLQLIDAAAELANVDPLKITNAEAETGLVEQEFPGKQTRRPRLSVTLQTNRPATGCLLYRLRGTADWTRLDLPGDKTSHRAQVVLPPEASADWIVIAWDNIGRVALTREPISGKRP